MYKLDPPAIYVSARVLAQKETLTRAKNVVESLGKTMEETIYMADEDIPEIVRDDNWRSLWGSKMGQIPPDFPDPVIVLNTFRWDAEVNELSKQLAKENPDLGGYLGQFLGHGAFAFQPYNLEGDPYRKDKVCRPAWRIHMVKGCPHRCSYCGLGRFMNVMLNVEDYIEKLAELIKLNPWQNLYLYEDDADVLCLEPEHGVLKPLVEYFATQENAYLLIHTKSANVDYMLDWEHKGHTIALWSHSASTQSRAFEEGTGTTEERIEAARKCQEAGYPIRYKFKPIIPVVNWREEAKEAIEKTMTSTNPDIISLCVLMWMPASSLRACLDESMLDPVYIKAMDESVDETKNTRTQPFPEWVRAEIYEFYLNEIRKYDKEIPVSLSTESWSMWNRMAPKLGVTATNYVCGCGAQAVPGLKKLKTNPFQAAREGCRMLDGEPYKPVPAASSLEYIISTAGEPDWRDYTVECDVTLKESAGVNCAGLLVRCDQNGENGMRFWIRCDNAAAQLAEWRNSSHYNILRTIPLGIKPEIRYHLKVIVENNLYQCFVNGKIVAEYEDATNLFAKGMIGLISCQARPVFENLKVFGDGFTQEISLALLLQKGK